jgi:hypothetical protein
MTQNLTNGILLANAEGWLNAEFTLSLTQRQKKTYDIKNMKENH